jgi:hypothetical protein
MFILNAIVFHETRVKDRSGLFVLKVDPFYETRVKDRSALFVLTATPFYETRVYPEHSRSMWTRGLPALTSRLKIDQFINIAEIENKRVELISSGEKDE